jgi:predicted ATP-dependent endonuclease of OLD family
LYISKIRLNNIRCFKDFSLKFESNGRSVLWTTILGDNAVGKTCLLRSIALGLCDEASAAALMKELPGEMLRNGTLNGYIHVELKGENGKEYTITTEIKKQVAKSPERVKQTTKPEEDLFPWDDIFLCGYGTQRAAEADRSFEKYVPLEAVYTLFNYSASLQNPEIILLRHTKHQKKLIDKFDLPRIIVPHLKLELTVN